MLLANEVLKLCNFYQYLAISETVVSSDHTGSYCVRNKVGSNNYMAYCTVICQWPWVTLKGHLSWWKGHVFKKIATLQRKQITTAIGSNTTGIFVPQHPIPCNFSMFMWCFYWCILKLIKIQQFTMLLLCVLTGVNSTWYVSSPSFCLKLPPTPSNLHCYCPHLSISSFNCTPVTCYKYNLIAVPADIGSSFYCTPVC